MSEIEIAIKIDHVSKDFLLPHEKADSIKSIFVNPFSAAKNRKSEVQHALHDINFEVEKGEFFGIVGRNGSGKSTLLKLIAGIYQPTKGKIKVNGRLVPFIELGVGFNPELTGRENVYLNGALMGFSEKEVTRKYKKIVDFAELERFMDQKLKNYSSGMQVRLAFSVATILANSEILLIDEVLAVGDADFQRKCFQYFKSLKKNHKTVIFVSHDMSAIREYCDRAAFINDSKLVAVDTAREIAKLYDKLFLETSQDEAVDDDKQEKNNRWGTGEAITESIKAEYDKNTITITQHVLSRINSVEMPIIGFRIRNAAGEEVAGTNTRIEQIQPVGFTKGSVYTYTWTFPNVLAEGLYIVDPAVLLPDGVTTCDWWDDATTLQIKKRAMPYDLDPGYSVSVK